MKLKECIAPEGAKRAAFQRTDAKEHESHNEGEFFSDIFFVSSTTGELKVIDLIDLLLNWRKDLISCDYLCANLYLIFFEKSLNIPVVKFCLHNGYIITLMIMESFSG